MKFKEGSAKDMAKDRKMAKKKGMSMKKWEGSPMDMAMDKGVKKYADGGSVKTARGMGAAKRGGGYKC